MQSKLGASLLTLFAPVVTGNITKRARGRPSRSPDIALLKQEMSSLRESWSEDDLNALPSEEPDIFDRKSGRLFADESKFLDSVAKAMSAFANSGGGSLLLGVGDDGVPDGLPTHVGRATMRDWLEQKIPHLLDYPISLFRVHTVTPSAPSRIPDDRAVIVIDVGDSPAAPHQNKRDKVYYHRVAGRSVPAPHFYIELLRQRLTTAALSFSLVGIRSEAITEYEGGLFYEAKLDFLIENTGRVAAYHWELSIRDIVPPDPGLKARWENRYHVGAGNFPLKKSRGGGFHLDKVILPGCIWKHEIDLGVQIEPIQRRVDFFEVEVKSMLKESSLICQLATENSPGEPLRIPLLSFVNVGEIVHFARQTCPGYFEREI